MDVKICRKCNTSNWGTWTSSSSGKQHTYCRRCRNGRALKYSSFKKANGGKHTRMEWLQKLSSTPACALCHRMWYTIPARPDKRYRNVWTKDHIIPLSKGGSDDIDNIQAVCYACNFAKCNRA